jgi:hypothetical protein
MQHGRQVTSQDSLLGQARCCSYVHTISHHGQQIPWFQMHHICTAGDCRNLHSLLSSDSDSLQKTNQAASWLITHQVRVSISSVACSRSSVLQTQVTNDNEEDSNHAFQSWLVDGLLVPQGAAHEHQWVPFYCPQRLENWLLNFRLRGGYWHVVFC